MIWQIYTLWNDHRKFSYHFSPYTVAVTFLLMRTFNIYLATFQLIIQCYWLLSPCYTLHPLFKNFILFYLLEANCNIDLVLPYIDMNPPWAYMCSPSWTSLPIPSLWVIPVYQPRAPCLMHWTWTGDLFHMIIYMFQWLKNGVTFWDCFAVRSGRWFDARSSFP